MPSLKARMPNTHSPRSLGMSPLRLATTKKTDTIIITPAIAGDPRWMPALSSESQPATSGAKIRKNPISPVSEAISSGTLWGY